MFRERRVPLALQHLHHRLLDESIQHCRNAQLAASHRPALEFRPASPVAVVGPAQQLFPNGWPVLLQVRWQLLDGHPVDSRTSLVGLDSCSMPAYSFPARRLLPSVVRLSPGFRFCASPSNDSVPSAELLGASLLLVSVKANSSWFFCRLSLMSCAAYLPLPLASSRRTVRAFTHTARATTPSADFCSPVRLPHCSLSRDSTTREQISRGKFDRLPRTTAGFTTSVLDGYGLRCHLPARPTPYASYPVLVHRLAPLLHASFRPRLATTPLRFANSSPPSG